jgi:hypothetical protein
MVLAALSIGESAPMRARKIEFFAWLTGFRRRNGAGRWAEAAGGWKGKGSQALNA